MGWTRASTDLWRRLGSFLQPQVLARCSTPFNPLLSVVEVNGHRRLDGLTVNYSHGSLHEVLAAAFERLELRRRPIGSALLLGFGGGSAVRLLRQEHGLDPSFTAVDIDPEVIALARRWFGFERDPRLTLIPCDAFDHVSRSSARYDLILVDAFVDAHVPERLRTREFVRLASERLTPGGLLVFNTLADTRAGRMEAAAIEEAACAALGTLGRIDVRNNRVLTWERPREVTSSS